MQFRHVLLRVQVYFISAAVRPADRFLGLWRVCRSKRLLLALPTWGPNLLKEISALTKLTWAFHVTEMLSLLGFSLSLFRTSALEGPPRVFVPNTRAASAHTQNMKSLRDTSGRARPGIAAFRGGSDIPAGALPHRCGHRTPAPQCPLRLPFLNSPLINTHLNPNSHQLSAGIHCLYFLYLTIELNNILSSRQNASSGFTCFIPTIFSMWGQRGPEKFKHPKLRDRFQILREWQIPNWRPASRLWQRGCTRRASLSRDCTVNTNGTWPTWRGRGWSGDPRTVNYFTRNFLLFLNVPPFDSEKRRKTQNRLFYQSVPCIINYHFFLWLWLF